MKSKPYDLVKVSINEFMLAMYWAQKKWEYSRRNGFHDRMRGEESSLILTDARAMLAEMAVADLMGWSWIGCENGAGKPDFVIDDIKVDVKSTIRQYPNLRIPIYGLKSIDRYVLVQVLSDHSRAKVYGWVTREKALENARKYFRPSGPFYEVALKHLTPMEEWK